MKKFILIQLWIGKIPDYFWTHLETTKNLNYVDFLFITDQKDLSIDLDNYKILYKDLDEIQELIRSKSGFSDLIIKNDKKVCDLKASLGHMFEEYIDSYEYFGFYDIDTLIGNLDCIQEKIKENYDVISFGDPKYYNRIGGPFSVLKNTKEIREFYIDKDFYDSFQNENVVCYEENSYSVRIRDRFRVEIIFNRTNIDSINGGKPLYDCVWSGGSLYLKDKEISLYHFYRKKNTKLNKVGNVISAFYDKKIVEDFYWVVHFSENYEKYIPHLIDSIKKFSNRKCVFYSINYFPKIALETQYQSEQFLFKRLDIPKGKIDSLGKDFNIMTLKPKVLLDAIKSFPNKKFVHIDTDIYFTTNSDGISKHFQSLENYPLANSHVHDVIFVRNVVPGEEWTSSLHVLMREEKIDKSLIYPRRKCNVILFDEKSEWFFEEQIKLYEKYRDSDVPGILSIYDEDTFNAILAKYELPKSLPLIDIEESHNLSMDKIHNYSYSIITKHISPNLIGPKTINDFLFFHGFKNVIDYEKIEQDYGKSVLSSDDIVVYYSNNSLFFEKNSFLTDKKDISIVNFVVKNLVGDVLFELNDQELNKFWFFYINNFNLERGIYVIEIYKKDNNQKIYGDLIEIK